MSGTWVWILGLGLLLLVKNTSGTCDVKFADGLGKNDKRIFVLGETAELKCDVTAMDPIQDVLYWKYVMHDTKVFSENDMVVLSENDRVMPLYEKKYNVSLGTVNGKKIYMLLFTAEADDVGKYNCTCGSGGIQYPVWVKVPCNKPQHVMTDKVTSKQIIHYLGKNEVPDVRCGTTVIFKMGLDCKCTWPEVNRKFIGMWKSPLPNSAPIPVPDGLQKSDVKPLSCYAGVGSVTFPYKDVIGSFNNIPFTCNHDTKGNEYGFYVDEGERTMAEPLMKVRCGSICPTTTTTTTPPPEKCPKIGINEVILILAGIVTFICVALVVKLHQYWKQGNPQKLRRQAVCVIAVLAVVMFFTILIFMLRYGNQLPDLSGNPIPPSCEIGAGSIVGFVIILLVALIAIIVYEVLFCKKRVENEKLGQEGVSASRDQQMNIHRGGGNSDGSDIELKLILDSPQSGV